MWYFPISSVNHRNGRGKRDAIPVIYNGLKTLRIPAFLMQYINKKLLFRFFGDFAKTRSIFRFG